MVCTNGTGLQSTSLEVASLTGTTLGPPKTLLSNCLCSSPSWAPDGSGLTYLAPADKTGHFQLWWIAGAAGTAPKAPQQVTTGLDFDGTSTPAWRP
jgi:Tol biopolymer transport system component